MPNSIAMKKHLFISALVLTVVAIVSCNKETREKNLPADTYPAIEATFSGAIDPDALENYAHQNVPDYINKDNTDGNPVTDKGATLGRVLFYDKNLSVNNTVSCASCHQQSNAFSDVMPLSQGVNGNTGRHSMRLINTRFADEVRFFWDERANTLEEQTTQPIQDHAEMGYSGQSGDPGISDLIVKLEGIAYYNELFAFVFGDAEITEDRMQRALAQFIRSIQSFDSKFDEGLMASGNLGAPFTNFTAEENQGKRLFLAPAQFNNGVRVDGGAGCAGCHRPPEFDIDPNSRNNGVTATAGNDMVSDLTNTRSPSLRDVTRTDGTLNGPLMHNCRFATLEAAIRHYNSIPANNANLDPRLRPQGNLQQLNLTTDEINSLVAFIKTLSGSEVYRAQKWGNPFPE